MGRGLGGGAAPMHTACRAAAWHPWASLKTITPMAGRVAGLGGATSLGSCKSQFAKVLLQTMRRARTARPMWTHHAPGCGVHDPGTSLPPLECTAQPTCGAATTH